LRQELMEKFGLDKPLTEQYVLYMRDAVRGDLGISVFTDRPVTRDLLDRLPATAELAILSFLLAASFGVTLGVIAAIDRDGPVDFLVRGVTLIGMSLPGFWLGLVVLSLFFFRFGWFPGPVGRFPIGGTPPSGPTGFFVLDGLITGDLSGARTAFHHMLLPAMTLAFVSMAPIARITRTAMVEALQSDYIRTARAMSIPSPTIYFRYALKNALLPVITIIGGTFGFMFGGTVLVESVFNWPGVGLYALGALQRADYPALQGFVIWVAIIYVLAYMFVDLLYYAVDPRLR
jgi:peptide/nickel transport system permease protein